jgi:hypothetical protein
MTSPNTSKRPTSVKSDIAANMKEDIRHLAYGFYEQRGREDGHDLEDWFRAEKKIQHKRSRNVSA